MHLHPLFHWMTPAPDLVTGAELTAYTTPLGFSVLPCKEPISAGQDPESRVAAWAAYAITHYAPGYRLAGWWLSTTGHVTVLLISANTPGAQVLWKQGLPEYTGQTATTAPRQALTETNAGRPSRHVQVADVLRFEATMKYVMAYTATGHYLLTDPLAVLESEFCAQFVRVHRGHLVRRSLITRVMRSTPNVYWCALANGPDVPLARRQRHALLAVRPDLARR